MMKRKENCKVYHTRSVHGVAAFTYKQVSVATAAARKVFSLAGQVKPLSLPKKRIRRECESNLEQGWILVTGKSDGNLLGYGKIDTIIFAIMPRGRLRAAILRIPETSRTLEDVSAGDCNSLKM